MADINRDDPPGGGGQDEKLKDDPDMTNGEQTVSENEAKVHEEEIVSLTSLVRLLTHQTAMAE